MHLEKGLRPLSLGKLFPPALSQIESLLPLYLYRLPLDRVLHIGDAAYLWTLLLNLDRVEFVAARALRLLHFDVLEAVYRLFLHL